MRSGPPRRARPEDCAQDRKREHPRAPPDATELAATIRETGTAQWLCEMGFEHEVDALCEFDSTDVVPRLRDGAFVAE